MSQKTMGILILVAGLLLAAASVLADSIGVGAMPGVFGWKQIIGVIVGVIGFVVGLYLLRRAGMS